MVRYEKPEHEVLIGMFSWKHEASLMPKLPRYVLHIGCAHAPRIGDDRTWVTAAAAISEDAEHFHIGHLRPRVAFDPKFHAHFDRQELPDPTIKSNGTR